MLNEPTAEISAGRHDLQVGEGAAAFGGERGAITLVARLFGFQPLPLAPKEVSNERDHRDRRARKQQSQQRCSLHKRPRIDRRSQ
jgi:hypothetical protein